MRLLTVEHVTTYSYSEPVQFGEHDGHLAQIPREIARRQHWPTGQAGHDYGLRPKMPARRVNQQWTGRAKQCAPVNPPCTISL